MRSVILPCQLAKCLHRMLVNPNILPNSWLLRDAVDVSVDHHGERAKEEGEAVDVTHSQGDDVKQFTIYNLGI